MKAATKKINGKKVNPNGISTDPEKNIVRLAKQGSLASAAKNAIAASFKKGLAVTVLEDGIIYRLYPGGKRTIVKKQSPNRKKYTSGKMIIR